MQANSQITNVCFPFQVCFTFTLSAITCLSVVRRSTRLSTSSFGDQNSHNSFCWFTFSYLVYRLSNNATKQYRSNHATTIHKVHLSFGFLYFLPKYEHSFSAKQHNFSSLYLVLLFVVSLRIEFGKLLSGTEVEINERRGPPPNPVELAVSQLQGCLFCFVCTIQCFRHCRLCSTQLDSFGRK